MRNYPRPVFFVFYGLLVGFSFSAAARGVRHSAGGMAALTAIVLVAFVWALRDLQDRLVVSVLYVVLVGCFLTLVATLTDFVICNHQGGICLFGF